MHLIKEIKIMRSTELNKCRAAEVLEICKNGRYYCSIGGKAREVKLDDIHAAEFISSEYLSSLDYKEAGNHKIIELTHNSAVDDIFRMHNKYRDKKIGILNFASAYHPGGGFITGALAQEEALCHASTLYIQLFGCHELYDLNKEENNSYYTDNMAISDTQFFMDSSRLKRGAPVHCTVITSAAVNLSKQGLDINVANAKMQQRMHKIIQLFIDREVRVIILGAFGCGVFKNDPNTIAEIWKDELNKYGEYFDKVIFSIMGSQETPNYKAFKRVFSENIR